MSIHSDKSIKFFFLTQGITLRNRNKLKQYLKRLIKKEGRKVGFINYIFCSDQYLLKINKQYLLHDYYTDIITFNLSIDHNIINAEIYISIDRIKDNSKNFKTTLREEMYRVIFHGILHLCGYKDKTTSERKEMRAKEDFYINKYQPTRST